MKKFNVFELLKSLIKCKRLIIILIADCIIKLKQIILPNLLSSLSTFYKERKTSINIVCLFLSTQYSFYSLEFNCIDERNIYKL